MDPVQGFALCGAVEAGGGGGVYMGFGLLGVRGLGFYGSGLKCLGFGVLRV